MPTVEFASLRHASEIVEVHRSDLESYRKWTGVGWEEASPEELDPCQWMLNGGPWMSVETCAIHLNNLLTRGQFPLVALVDGRVVGEAELLVGHEGERRGLVAHLSVIDVHRDYRGRGLGRALVEASKKLAQDSGAEMLTVVPEEEAKGFYEALGFALRERWIEVEVTPGRLREPHMEAGLVSLDPEDFDGMELVVGRYQSGANIAFNLCEEFAGCEVLDAGTSWAGVVEGVEFVAHFWEAPFLDRKKAYVWVKPDARRSLEDDVRLGVSTALALARSPISALVPEAVARELGEPTGVVVEFWGVDL